MKKIPCRIVLIVLAVTLGFHFPAMAGSNTAHGFFYKPAYNEKGPVVYDRYNAALDATDLILYNLTLLPGGTTAGPGYVVAGDYGTDQAALATADSVASSFGKLLVIGRTYSITGDLTLSSQLQVMPGAIITVATTKTLTINGSLDAGPYHIFSCVGTGRVLFGNGAITECYLEWFGGKGDTSDNVSAWNSAITSITSANGRAKLKLLSGQYKFTTAITKPYNITLEGTSGISGQTFMYFSNATDGIVVDGITEYPIAAPIKDIYVHGSNTALKGIQVLHTSCQVLENVYVNSFTQQGILIDNCIKPKLSNVIASANGGPSYAQIEVDNSTCFLWDNSYISGNNLVGNTIAGFRVDRTGPITMIGGAIESTDVPIQICSKAESVMPVQSVTIMGLDLENPGNGHAYIEAGYGWTGTTGSGVVGLTLLNLGLSPSGTTSIPYAIKLKNTCNFQIQNMGSVGVDDGSSTTAFLKLEGTTNKYANTGVFSTPIAIPLVEENGIFRIDASPSMPWYQAGTSQRVFFSGSLTANSATPFIPIPLMGGVATNNSTPTTITNLRPTGDARPPHGQIFYLECADANTTIANMGSGSYYFQIMTPTGASVTLVNGKIYQFIYNDTTANWVMMTH